MVWGGWGWGGWSARFAKPRAAIVPAAEGTRETALVETVASIPAC